MNELADTLEFIDLRGNDLTGVLPPELCDKLPDYDPDNETFVCEFTGDNSPSPTNMETLSPTCSNDLDCSKTYSSSSYEIQYVKKRPHCDNLACFFNEKGLGSKLCATTFRTATVFLTRPTILRKLEGVAFYDALRRRRNKNLSMDPTTTGKRRSQVAAVTNTTFSPTWTGAVTTLVISRTPL